MIKILQSTVMEENEPFTLPMWEDENLGRLSMVIRRCHGKFTGVLWEFGGTLTLGLLSSVGFYWISKLV